MSSAQSASERLRDMADAMDRAADLEADDGHRPVTRFDAREWAEGLREIAAALDQKERQP